jgi:hypothetical protein
MLSALLGFWYVGGDVMPLATVHNKPLIQIVIAVLSTPAVGWIVSSFGAWIGLRCLKKRRLFLDANEAYRTRYLAALDYYFPKDVGRNGEQDTMYFNHQLLLRELANEEVIKFTTRRFDSFWSHSNTIISIGSGILLGIWIKCYYDESQMYCHLQKSFFILPLLGYISYGASLAYRDLKDACDFEKKFLIYKYESTKNSGNTRQYIRCCKR